MDSLYYFSNFSVSLKLCLNLKSNLMKFIGVLHENIKVKNYLFCIRFFMFKSCYMFYVRRNESSDSIKMPSYNKMINSCLFSIFMVMMTCLEIKQSYVASRSSVNFSVAFISLWSRKRSDLQIRSSGFYFWFCHWLNTFLNPGS